MIYCLAEECRDRIDGWLLHTGISGNDKVEIESIDEPYDPLCRGESRQGEDSVIVPGQKLVRLFCKYSSRLDDCIVVGRGC